MATTPNNSTSWSPSSSFCSPLDKEGQLFSVNDMMSFKDKFPTNNDSSTPIKHSKAIAANTTTTPSSSSQPSSHSKFVSPTSVADSAPWSSDNVEMDEGEIRTAAAAAATCVDKDEIQTENANSDEPEKGESSPSQEGISAADQALEIQIETLHQSLGKLSM
jgi:hypothetical protein